VCRPIPVSDRSSEARSFFLRLSRGQSLGQPHFEFGPSRLQRAFEEIAHRVKTARFVVLKFIDTAVFKDSGGKCQLLCGVVNKKRAVHKLATTISGKNAFAFKIKMRSLETFAVNDAFIRRVVRLHFCALTSVSDPALANRSAFNRARFS
jgi:hypothetical protein